MFWRRKRKLEDFSEELRAHLALEADQLRQEGLAAEQARAAAHRNMGNIMISKERFHESGGWMWAEQFWQDLRISARQLAKSKGFTFVAVLTLALGIGANSAVFTLVNAVMLQKLPVKNPEQLYMLGRGDNCCVIGGYQARLTIYSYPLYQYLRDNTPEFEQMAAFMAGLPQFSVRHGNNSEPPEPFVGSFISGNYFATLGATAAAGRAITDTDDAPGAPPVAVMSYRAWQQHYGLDPSVIGSTFTLNGVSVTLIGVMPRAFFGETLRPDPPDFWVPLSAEPLLQGQNSLLRRRDEHWLYAIGRLKTGVQPATVEAKINLSAKQWFMEEGGSKLSPSDIQSINRQHILVVSAAGGVSSMQREYAEGLRLLMTISGLVLVIACANIANLLLARRTASRLPASIRVALGASRSRVVRQTLTESVLLAMLGGVAGLFVAFAGTHLILTLAFQGARFVPIHDDPSLPVLAFTFLISLLAGCLFGVAPAWIGSRTDPADVLRGGARSTGGHSTVPQKALVILQAAVSLVLLAYAGLLTQSLRNLEHQQFGFETAGRIMVKVNPSFVGYKPERIAHVYQQIGERLSQIPGVRSASFSLYSPMENMNWQSGVFIEGAPEHDANGRMRSATWDRVSAHYFETIGSRLLSGRTIDDRDIPGARPVAVINQAFAKRFFPNEVPLGKHFGLEGPGDYEIVGVVEDTKYSRAREPMWPMFFLPLLQMPASDWAKSGLARSNYIRSVQIRTAGAANDLEGLLRRSLTEIDSGLTVSKVFRFDEQLAVNFNQDRLLARLTGTFGLVALILASIGLYGVTAYAVARRTSEIGIRMALGAGRQTVIGMVLRSAFLQAAIGLAIGIPAALAGARVLANQLFGIRPYDPWMLAGATLVLGLSALLASLIPAYRAAGIDPVRALRTE
jgi:predicted permease